MVEFEKVPQPRDGIAEGGMRDIQLGECVGVAGGGNIGMERGGALMKGGFQSIDIEPGVAWLAEEHEIIGHVPWRMRRRVGSGQAEITRGSKPIAVARELQ